MKDGGWRRGAGWRRGVPAAPVNHPLPVPGATCDRLGGGVTRSAPW